MKDFLPTQNPEHGFAGSTSSYGADRAELWRHASLAIHKRRPHWRRTKIRQFLDSRDGRWLGEQLWYSLISERKPLEQAIRETVDAYDLTGW